MGKVTAIQEEDFVQSVLWGRPHLSTASSQQTNIQCENCCLHESFGKYSQKLTVKKSLLSEKTNKNHGQYSRIT